MRLDSEIKGINVFVSEQYERPEKVTVKCGSRIGSLASFGVPMTVYCSDTELKSQHVYILTSVPGETFTLIEFEVYAVGMFE